MSALLASASTRQGCATRQRFDHCSGHPTRWERPWWCEETCAPLHRASSSATASRRRTSTRGTFKSRSRTRSWVAHSGNGSFQRKPTTAQCAVVATRREDSNTAKNRYLQRKDECDASSYGEQELCNMQMDVPAVKVRHTRERQRKL